LKVLRVTVVPRSIEELPETRTRVRTVVKADVAVQKKLASDEGTEPSELLALVATISEALRFRTLVGCPYAVWTGTVQEPPYSVEHLSRQRVFTAVLTVSYRL